MNKKIEESIVTSLDSESSTDVCLYKSDESGNEFEDVSIIGKEGAAMALNISPELADALIMLTGDLTEKFKAINRDLKFLGAKILD